MSFPSLLFSRYSGSAPAPFDAINGPRLAGLEGSHPLHDVGIEELVRPDDGSVRAEFLLDVALSHPDGSRESFVADHAAAGDEVVIRWPFDFRIPRTPGVNTARWTVDPDGTLRFVQLDDEITESWLAVPWSPVAAS